MWALYDRLPKNPDKDWGRNQSPGVFLRSLGCEWTMHRVCDLRGNMSRCRPPSLEGFEIDRETGRYWKID